MEAPDLARAIEAGRATAGGLDLRVDDVFVINDSDRVVLRLLPCDVLVRVAPETHRAGSEFEIEVARQLAAVGSPVAELEPRVDPRAYSRADFVISFWTYYEPVGSPLAPGAYTKALQWHHAAMRQVDLDAPHFTDQVAEALRELDDRAQTPDLLDPDRELLRTTLRGLSTAIGSRSTGEQLLHGEAHAGNVLNTSKGPLFVDLGTCCRGPVEFDLAHAPDEVSDHYPGG